MHATSHTIPETAANASPIDEMLRDIRPDELSPRDALELLYRLKSLLPD